MQHVPPYQTEPQLGAATNGTVGANTMMKGSNPLPAPVLMPLPAATPEGEGKLDLPGIWNAFRRRWFLALSLGLLLGIPAAIAAWTYAPAPYVAFVELRINSINPQAFPGSRNVNIPNFDVWKQTILKRATHPNLLNTAIQNAKLENATMIRERQPYATAWLEDKVMIKSAGREYFQLELEGEYPAEVADILNAIAKSLVADVDADQHRQRVARKEKLDDLLDKCNEIINRNRNELFRKREEAQRPNPTEVGQRKSFLLELRTKLQAALLEIEVAKTQLQLQMPTFNGEPNQSQVEKFIEQLIDQDPRYLRAAGEVVETERKITDQESYVKRQEDQLSPTHPSLTAARKDLAGYKEQLKTLKDEEQAIRKVIREEIEASLPEEEKKKLNPEEILKKRQEVLETKFAETEKKLNDEIKKIELEQQDLDRFSREAELLTEVIEREKERQERFRDEVERLQFEIDNTPPLVEVSREAKAPHSRSLKKKTMLSGVAGLGVLGFFVAGIVFLEYRTQRIATLNQVSERLNLRVMGTVPLLPRSAANGSSTKKRAKNALWYSALTEAIDSTRTILIRGSQLDSLKTIMVASATGGEGKTTLASHLATSLARGGRKILLIDCDLRRPCMHRAFDLAPGDGVCEILRGEVDIADCIQELESPAGLSVLPAGKINQQVLKMLALHALEDMLEPLKAKYDFIIVDSSPLLPVTDGLLVAQHVDGVILSIRRDVSRVGKVVMATQKLSMLGIPLLGAVTIGLQEESRYSQKSAYKHYSYGAGQYYYTQPPA